MPDRQPVLVTGANSGIGLATAVELARRGHRVTGTVRSEAKAEPLQALARERGVEVAWSLLDVTDADRCAEVVDEVAPTVVVNNAGYGMTAPVELVPDDDARHLIETMLVAPVRLARLALPHQRAAGGGRTVMVSSILGRVTLPLTGWYQASKHGLEAVSDALRTELADDGVHVILVEPGFFRTGIFDDLQRDAERYDDGRYGAAFERMEQGMRQVEWAMGDPAKVARVIARAVDAPRPPARALVGPDARWLDAVTPFVPTAVRDRLARLSIGR